MKKAQAKLKKLLKGVKDICNVVQILVDLIYEEPDRQEIDRYLQAFKASYSYYSFYPDMTKTILSQVELLGMDFDHIKDML